MQSLLNEKKEKQMYQQNLESALHKYAPPKENEYGEKRAASRGGVNMNMYEKMFFANGGKDMQLNNQSLKADSALLPIDHDKTITNYFNNGPIKRQQDTFKLDKRGVPIFESTPEKLKNTDGYAIPMDNYSERVEIPTINANIKKQVKREKERFDYGLSEDPTINADDTFDFINKINNVGSKKKPERQFSGVSKVRNIKIHLNFYLEFEA